MTSMQVCFRAFLFAVLIAILPSAIETTAADSAGSVESVMDDLVGRLMQQMSEEELSSLDDTKIMAILTPEEKEILATRYLHFKVNVPVTVSVMHETGQPVTPYWLSERGFNKTEMEVTNTENWVYEVWQKDFEPGEVGLGINGFDKHRQHYFVTVGPKNEGDKVEISDLFPSEYSIGWMHEGASVYHDWTELLLKDVPRELRGDRLLTTIRGRAREAHLIGGFRKTPHPSSKQPDQVILTWSQDPKTSQTVQWRTSTEIRDGQAQYWPKGTDRLKTVSADYELIEDRVLINDPKCHHFTATLTALEPGTEYEYRVGSPKEDVWSQTADFTTAPAQPEPFLFVAFGDTHKKEAWGEMLEKVGDRHPEAAFYAIAGDLVDTGQYRDDWDQFFHLGRDAFNRKPLIPCIGNHDAIDGLGPGMYRALLGLPENGPENIDPERAFTLEYGNLLYIVLDSGLSAIDQAAWLEEQLANSDATWKVAMFHFPPYNYEEPYPEIKALWGYLFDKYQVDFAIEGHIHYYMRSHPIFQDKPVKDPKEGTTHVLTIPIPNRERDLPPAPYAAVQLTGVPVYQTFQIDGNHLTFRTYDLEGEVRDEVVIEK
jgi:hypothetical protein